jgi:hypothetical protein
VKVPQKEYEKIQATELADLELVFASAVTPGSGSTSENASRAE